jgi:hypothetical protein
LRTFVVYDTVLWDGDLNGLEPPAGLRAVPVDTTSEVDSQALADRIRRR